MNIENIIDLIESETAVVKLSTDVEVIRNKALWALKQLKTICEIQKRNICLIISWIMLVS